MMKKPARKSWITFCAPKPTAAETTVAGRAALIAGTPRFVRASRMTMK